MKIIKTNEVSSIVIDWMVAKCEGKNDVLHDDGITRCIVIAAASGVYKGIWKPTVNWSQGGPIIERELIELSVSGETLNGMWVAKSPDWYLPATGPTPLIAAMRCYVTSKLGDSVEVPNELLGN